MDGASAVGGTGLGLGFPDRWKKPSNGDVEDEEASFDTKIDALGLREDVAGEPIIFEEFPLACPNIVGPVDKGFKGDTGLGIGDIGLVASK